MAEEATETQTTENNPAGTETKEGNQSTENQTQTSDDKSTTVIGSGGKVEPTPPGVLETKEETAAAESGESDEFDIEFSENTPFNDSDQESIAAKFSDLGLDQKQSQDMADSLERVYQAGQESQMQDVAQMSKDKQRELFSHENFSSDERKKESFEAIEGVINAYGDAGFKQFLNGPAGDDVRLANFLRWVGLKTGSGKEGSILGKGTDGSSPNNEENSGLGRYASLFGPK